MTYISQDELIIDKRRSDEKELILRSAKVYYFSSRTTKWGATYYCLALTDEDARILVKAELIRRNSNDLEEFSDWEARCYKFHEVFESENC
jgi:hypothetical protein